MNFDTRFDCVTPVVCIDNDEKNLVFLFDNKDNVIAVFPQGKLKYPFYRDLIQAIVEKIDFNLWLISECESRPFHKSYVKHFKSKDKKLRKLIADFKI